MRPLPSSLFIPLVRRWPDGQTTKRSLDSLGLMRCKVRFSASAGGAHLAVWCLGCWRPIVSPKLTLNGLITVSSRHRLTLQLMTAA
jgi:hypothetical protein